MQQQIAGPAQSDMDPGDAAVMQQGIRTVRIRFAVLGMLVGAWGAHIPSIKDRYGLGEAALSSVLVAAALGTVAMMFAAGRLVGLLGTRRAASAGGWALCAALSAVLVLPNTPLLLGAAFVLGAAMSLFDVAINTAGSELEHDGGRAVMGSLHGMFSLGGMAGAGLVAALLAAGLAPSLQLAAISGALATVLACVQRGGERAGKAAANGGVPFAWPRGQLLVIGLLILAGMTAESAMVDWCVLYLKQELGMPQAQAALGYAAFSAAMAAMRFAGDALRMRFSERAVLLAGAGLAALAMALVLLIALPWVALLGFVMVGAGLAPVAPILFNAATRVPGVSRAAAIASVTSIGYAGFMVAPPLIGGLAQATSLSAALWLVVAAAVVLACGVSRVPLAAHGFTPRLPR